MKNPRYWKLLAFTIAVIAIFSPVRLHKAEIGTDDKYLDIGILHS